MKFIAIASLAIALLIWRQVPRAIQCKKLATNVLVAEDFDEHMSEKYADCLNRRPEDLEHDCHNLPDYASMSFFNHELLKELAAQCLGNPSSQSMPKTTGKQESSPVVPGTTERNSVVPTI